MRQLFVIVILLTLTGCSDHADFRLGVVTRSVSGSLSVDGEVSDVQPFILVRKYNRMLVETSSGPLYRVSAEIVRPMNGQYTVSMESEVNRLELTFFGRRHRPVSYFFKRTLGISEYLFDARLKPDAAWKDSYYLLIRPELMNYIIEQRFNMRRSDQLFLGEWMDRTELEMKK